MDLINFSDTDIMDTGNLGEKIPFIMYLKASDWLIAKILNLTVIGKDISPISFDTSAETSTAFKNTKKSGVEVFLEERSHEERSEFLFWINRCIDKGRFCSNMCSCWYSLCTWKFYSADGREDWNQFCDLVSAQHATRGEWYVNAQSQISCASNFWRIHTRSFDFPPKKYCK